MNECKKIINEYIDFYLNNHSQVETQNNQCNKTFLIVGIESVLLICSNSIFKNAKEKKY
tara:strand:- start:210 stop:386 length:177 start_codon:yes stop_codon:yes gene_type:complete